jgi:hypothetical protein
VGQPDSSLRALSALVEEYVAEIHRLTETPGEVSSFENLARLLARLHAAMRCLPEVQWEPHEVDAASYHPALEVPRIYERLQHIFGDADAYPSPSSSITGREIWIGSLADDLADIYGDLAAGLETLRSGASLQAVAWDWRFSFESHWGAHLLDASRAIHRLITGT